MNNGTEKVLILKLAIRIPEDGSAPEASIVSSEQMRVAAPIEVDVIEEPQSGARMTTPAGDICLRGLRNNSTATEVWAKIFPGSDVPAPPVDPAAIGASKCDFEPLNGEFRLDKIGGVTGYPYTQPPHVIVAWEKVGPYFYQNDAVRFYPVWGPYTECNYPFPDLFRRGRSQAAPLNFELLPVRWRLQTKSFQGGGAEVFNGSWTVTLQSTLDQRVVYCNGGDGVKCPRVQMVCESPFAEVWELRFRLGTTHITYSLAAAEFQRQSENRFSLPYADCADEDTALPLAVVVRPV